MFNRLHAMRVFVLVAETGSFAKTARTLGMSAPAVTRAIASLERALDCRLLLRTTRSTKVTEAGVRYLEDCRRILADIEEAEAAAAGSIQTPSGVLTLSAPVQFGRLHALPILTEFIEQYPHVTGRALFLDRVTLMVEEGIDVAIRIGHLPDSGYTAIRVGQVRRVVCGTASYLKKYGVPQRPEDLKLHRLIVSAAAWSVHTWHFGRESKAGLPVQAALSCNTNDAAIAASLSGYGLTQVLSYQISAEIKDHRLKVVLADHEQPPLPVHIIYPGGRRISAKVRAFVDLAAKRLRANPAIH